MGEKPLSVRQFGIAYDALNDRFTFLNRQQFQWVTQNVSIQKTGSGLLLCLGKLQNRGGMFHTVAKTFDLRTGICWDEKYKFGNKLHRDPNEGPAWIERSEDGRVVHETYSWHGRRHRVGGPAVISYMFSLDLLPSLEMYFQHGKLHRDPAEGPALIERRGGTVTSNIYYVHGQQYRDPAEGPCYIVWDEEGKGILEIEYSPAPRRKSPARQPPSPGIAPK